MPNGLKNGAHLILVVAAFLAGLAIFLIVRQNVVPEGFGRYGHYRAAALDDNRLKPVSFAGRQVCIGCHYEVDGVITAGKHRHISCETCHGAQSVHAGDPASGAPPRPKTEMLCRTCHEADNAKPRHFPQVASADHSGGVPCGGCHQPHKPGLGVPAAKERSQAR